MYCGRESNKSLSLWPAACMALAVAVSNGFARFAYGLILPAMREDLDWTYAITGALNTWFAVGYLLGAACGFIWLQSANPRTVFRLGLLIVVVTLLLTPAYADLHYLGPVRFVTGVGAAWIFSCGAGLVSAIYANDERNRGKAIGVYFAGAGIGMIASGLVLPPLIAAIGDSAWKQAWLILGLISAVSAIPPYLAAGKSRSNLAGGESARGPVQAQKLPLRPYAVPLAAYTLFGAGSNAYLTFLVAWIEEQGQSWILTSATWSLLGIGICACPLLWRHPLQFWPATRTLAYSTLVAALGVGLCMLGANELVVLASAALFGSSVFIAPAAVTLMARTTRPQRDWAAFVALFTTMFSVGQAIGPVVAGTLSDGLGLAYGLLLSTVLLLASAAIANVPSQARTLSIAGVRQA